MLGVRHSHLARRAVASSSDVLGCPKPAVTPTQTQSERCVTESSGSPAVSLAAHVLLWELSRMPWQQWKVGLWSTKASGRRRKSDESLQGHGL